VRNDMESKTSDDLKSTRKIKRREEVAKIQAGESNEQERTGERGIHWSEGNFIARYPGGFSVPQRRISDSLDTEKRKVYGKKGRKEPVEKDGRFRRKTTRQAHLCRRNH